MEIPEPGEEGYIIVVTEENRKYLSEIYGWNLRVGYILNYDRGMGNPLSASFFSYSKFDEDSSHITANSTEITVEQLQQLLFIESLEN